MASNGQFRRGILTFDVTESGPADGEPVLLLHGFPQHRDCWDQLVPVLNAAGYRTVAFDQRGYSPRARPRGRWAYRVENLVADAAAVVDHYSGEDCSMHVVGHDWGAAVAWTLTSAHPDKVRSLTAVSVPHPAAFRRAVFTSRQFRASWYVFLFQIPVVPEMILRRRFLRLFVARGGQTIAAARRDLDGFLEPGAFTGAVNWYRAMLLSSRKFMGAKVRRPTLFVWSDNDKAVDRKGVDLTTRHLAGPYEFHELTGVSHWIPDEAPEKLAAVLLPHLKRWS